MSQSRKPFARTDQGGIRVVEHKLFEGDEPFVSTFEFHEHRERAPHLEQSIHQGRLNLARELALIAADWVRKARKLERRVKIVDLGCGDGGLLQLLAENHMDITAFGYDFQPSNVDGWRERQVDASALNFVDNWPLVIDADVYTITECLEHLARPHEMIKRIYDRGAHIVASSPYTEHAGSHDECHAWAWDKEGYAEMLVAAGFEVREHMTTGMFQVVWGIS